MNSLHPAGRWRNSGADGTTAKKVHRSVGTYHQLSGELVLILGVVGWEWSGSGSGSGGGSGSGSGVGVEWSGVEWSGSGAEWGEGGEGKLRLASVGYAF